MRDQPSDRKENSEPPSYPSNSPIDYENDNFEFDDNFFTLEDDGHKQNVRVRHRDVNFFYNFEIFY